LAFLIGDASDGCIRRKIAIDPRTQEVAWASLILLFQDATEEVHLDLRIWSQVPG
jgi:hypothetical protein